jgi:hypothetical protein
MPLNIIFKGIFLLVSEGENSMRSTKSLDVFVKLSKDVLSFDKIKLLVIDSSFEEQIAFHKVYLRFLELSLTERERTSIEMAYPFVKVGGRWKMSVPAFYVFLLRTRAVMSRIGNKKLFTVYTAIQRVDRYNEETRELYKSLQPKVFENYQEYQDGCRLLYEEMMTQQASIWEELERRAE